MAVMDEFQKERDMIKEAPLKDRIEYFYDYYKWHVIVALIVIAVFGSVVVDVITNKEVALAVTLINNYTYEDDGYDALIEEYAELVGIDLETQEIYIDNEYYLDFVEEDYDHVEALTALYALVSANAVDVFASDQDTLARLAYKDMLLPLEDCFSEEFLEEYADCIVYIDGVVQEELYEIGLDLDYSGEYPDYVSGDPEGMEDPIAIGIIFEYDSILGVSGAYLGDYGVIGIASTSESIEYAMEFIEYVIQEGE